jgi:SAM-dependent methyltransferase
MIVCTECGCELTSGTGCLVCPGCDRRTAIIDGTVMFKPEVEPDFADYDAAGLELLVRAEERHFWFRARRQVILSLFDMYVRKDERIIEIGAGTGSVSKALARHGYRVAVGEIHRSGLEYARRQGLAERYQFDVTGAPFRDHFDVVGLFDVIEHITDERRVLENVRRMLKPGGRLIGTVPAYGRLWSRSDVVARHKRRYSFVGLSRLLESSEFDVLEVRGFFVTLLPLLFLRALLNPASEAATAGTGRELAIVPVLNEVALAVLSAEHRILGRARPRIGSSIAWVARRR